MQYQATVPIGKHQDCPISVSFVSFHGADKFLLDTVLDMYSCLQEQVSVASNSLPLPDTNGNMDASELLKEKVCSSLLFHIAIFLVVLELFICVTNDLIITTRVLSHSCFLYESYPNKVIITKCHCC